jgi:hypothetical protein
VPANQRIVEGQEPRASGLSAGAGPVLGRVFLQATSPFCASFRASTAAVPVGSLPERESDSRDPYIDRASSCEASDRGARRSTQNPLRGSRAASASWLLACVGRASLHLM